MKCFTWIGFLWLAFFGGLLAASEDCFSEGTEYILAFPSNVNDWHPRKSRGLDALVSNFKADLITVHLEADPSVKTEPLSFKIKSNSSLKIPLDDRKFQLNEKLGSEKKAIRVFSNDSFELFGLNKVLYSGDGYLALPTHSLGSHYIVACHWPASKNCQLAVAGVERGEVEITITLPQLESVKDDSNLLEDPSMVEVPYQKKCAVISRGKEYTNGDTITATLKPLDVLQLQDACDLTGTKVESVNGEKLAVWSGNVRTSVGGGKNTDHLIEMLLPTTSWGRDCLAWPTPKAKHADFWLIVAKESNTTLTIRSMEPTGLRKDIELENPGEAYRMRAFSVSTWMHFSSDKPFQAFKMSRSPDDQGVPTEKAVPVGDSAMTTCIPTSGFDTGYLSQTVELAHGVVDSYVSVITEAKSKKYITLDEKPLDPSLPWQQIPNSSYVGAHVKIHPNEPLSTTFRVGSQKGDIKFGAYYYGAGPREGFGYPLGICFGKTRKGQQKQSIPECASCCARYYKCAMEPRFF